MNHLPIPEHRQRPSSRVLLFGYYDIPFLGQIAEPNDDFYAYADQHNLVEQNEKHTPNLSGLQDMEDADLYFARVQAWLYFGLIADTFAPGSCPQDLIVTNPSTNEQIINSTKLKLYMSQWRLTVNKMRNNAKADRAQRVKDSTTAAWKFCNQLDHYGLPITEVHMLIVFSIRILVCSLWDMLAANDMGGARLNDEFRISVDIIRWPHMPASYRPLVMLMIEYDWCTHEILRLLDTYNLTTVWSITCLQRRHASHLDHSRCAQATKCVARDVNPVNHRAQHLTWDCNCEAIGPDIEEVSKILQDGGIPLVRCTVLADGGVSLKVIPAKGSKRHIAFSHVWADGMVIPKENKVFQCQFLKLVSYLQKARPRVQSERLFYLPFAPFLARNVFKGSKSFDIWLDIFCIPSVVRPEFQELRKKAIARIYPVFAGAEAVLVVDKALTQIKDTDMSTMEIMARVASSGWMTRSWTFSEASLAQQSIMLFCIGENLVDYSKFQHYTKGFKKLDLPSRSLFSDLLRTSFYPFHIAWFASQPVVTEYVGFAFVWNALTARSTSWPDDAWGIMATLLGYSGREIMDLLEQNRLPAMMRDLPAVPASFFFRNLPRSPSAPAHMRWIPTRIQGRIRDVDGKFAFARGGIMFPPSLKFKFLLSTNGQLPHAFSFELAHEDLAARQPATYFEVDIHDHSALTQHVGDAAQICILLPWTEGRPGDSEAEYISGNGCCLLVRHIQPRSIVEGDFISSLSYKFTPQKQQNHFQASMAGPIVMIPCDREQWYRPTNRRKKHSLPPWTMSRILYFGVPTVLVSIMAITMIPLWVWYKTTGQSSHTRDILFYSTCGFVVFIVVVQWVVIFHERILIGNWIDSFEDREGVQAPWWKRIMPLY